MDMEGVVSDAPEKITGCTQQEVEVQVTKVYWVTIIAIIW